jgi:Ca2+-binding EF-hand superfamily protein
MGGIDELSADQVTDLQNGFDRYCDEGSQDILTTNIGSVVRFLGMNPTDNELEDMKNEADKDKVGTVDFSNFAEMFVKACKSGDTEEELLEGFKIFDLDGNGFISPEEFQQVTHGLGEVCTTDEITEMVSDQLIRIRDSKSQPITPSKLRQSRIRTARRNRDAFHIASDFPAFERHHARLLRSLHGTCRIRRLGGPRR